MARGARASARRRRRGRRHGRRRARTAARRRSRSGSSTSTPSGPDGELAADFELPRRPRLDPPPRDRDGAPPRAATSAQSRHDSTCESRALASRRGDRAPPLLRPPAPRRTSSSGSPPGRRSSSSAGRLVPPGNLHVTLAFLGSRARRRRSADRPRSVLRDAPARLAGPLAPRARVPRDAERRDARARRRGRARRGARRRAPRAARAARASTGASSGRGLPHVTVLRFRERPRLRPTLPSSARSLRPRLLFTYPVLHPSGAQYEVLESVALGG